MLDPEIRAAPLAKFDLDRNDRLSHEEKAALAAVLKLKGSRSG